MTSINDFKEKVKPFYTLFLIILVASIFFALGRISVINEKKTPIKVLNQVVSEELSSNQLGSVVNSLPQNKENTSGGLIGSKTGTKYYYPWCSTAKRIKPENIIKFSSIEDARAKGYTPAQNCAGLK